LHDIADLADLHREHRVFERADHRAAAEVVEVAAALGTARVVAVGLGQFGELGRRFAQLLEQRLGLGLGLLALGCGLVLVGRDQDVAPFFSAC
jgi:hypothetical protein